MKFSCYVQVIGVVAFMDADSLLPTVRTEQRLEACLSLLRLGDAAVAIVLAERIVPHKYTYKPSNFFCQMQKEGDHRPRRGSATIHTILVDSVFAGVIPIKLEKRHP